MDMVGYRPTADKLKEKVELLTPTVRQRGGSETMWKIFCRSTCQLGM